MSRSQYCLRIGLIAAVFWAGFISGSATERNAHAQLGEIGGDIMKRAGGGGGAIGSVVQLGTAIKDMEKNVNGLQKNLDMLKKVKAALGG